MGQNFKNCIALFQSFKVLFLLLVLVSVSSRVLYVYMCKSRSGTTTPACYVTGASLLLYREDLQVKTEVLTSSVLQDLVF